MNLIGDFAFVLVPLAGLIVAAAWVTTTDRFKAWRKRRYWQARQFENLRIMITGDARWLAHDPVARALTERYEAALRDDWYTVAHYRPDAFRRRIGLEPNYAATHPAQPPQQTGEPSAEIKAARLSGFNTALMWNGRTSMLVDSYEKIAKGWDDSTAQQKEGDAS